MHLHHLKGAGRAALIAAGLGMALGSQHSPYRAAFPIHYREVSPLD